MCCSSYRLIRLHIYANIYIYKFIFIHVYKHVRRAHPQSDSQQYCDNCANTRARSTLYRLPPLNLALSLPSLPIHTRSLTAMKNAANGL